MKPALSVAFLLACLGLGACNNQYYERKDTVSFSAGDAVATNIAVQVPDPWPKRSEDTKIPMDPVKADLAIQKYRYRDMQRQAPAIPSIDPGGMGAGGFGPSMSGGAPGVGGAYGAIGGP